jgi:hypothetical protein
MVKNEKSQGKLSFWLGRLRSPQQIPPAEDE